MPNIPTVATLAVWRRQAGFVVFALMCLALVGCATEEQRQTMQIVREAQDIGHVCQAKIEANPQYARIYQKLAFDTVNEKVRLPTAPQIADSEVISDSDKSTLYAWYSESETCMTPAFEDLGRAAPELQIYTVDAMSGVTEMFSHVMNNPYTFGQMNAELANFKQNTKVKAAAAVNDLKTRWRQQEAENAANVALTVGYIALAVATRGKMSFEHLASRQTSLARTQEDYLRMHPAHTMLHRVRIIHCDGIGRSLSCTLTNVSY